MKPPSQAQFAISVAAQIFFDQTPYWLRYQEKKGSLVDTKGNQIGTRKQNRAEGGDRIYTLDDISDMAHALYRAGAIDAEGLLNCRGRIESMHRPVYRRKKRRT